MLFNKGYFSILKLILSSKTKLKLHLRQDKLILQRFLYKII